MAQHATPVISAEERILTAPSFGSFARLWEPM